MLECGVEIIATPPGKPSFNNSLLSGGEKALTAVALLLAIFQFRPSPFCVLDEVDAPFDEANIGRFIDVLQGFSRLDAVRDRHAQQKNDDRRHDALRRDDAGVGRLQAGQRPLRRRDRRRPYPPRSWSEPPRKRQRKTRRSRRMTGAISLPACARERPGSSGPSLHRPRSR